MNTFRHTDTDQHLPPAPSRSRRTALAAFAALATFVAAGCAASSEETASPAAAGEDATGVVVAAPPAADADVPADAPAPATTAPATDPEPNQNESAPEFLTGDAAEDAADALDDSAPEPADPPPAPEPPSDDDDGDDDADDPVDLDPVPQESHPCDFLVPNGSSLVVGPDPLVLEPGDLTGSLSIVNCSDGDIDWTAQTKPSVTLDDDGANLLPGETAELDFAIDADQWDPGAIEFKIKISEPGHNHYVDIHAFRKLVGQDVVAGGNTLTAGPGAGGCANQCIVSALLDTQWNTADLGLDIETNTAATIRTWVSTSTPIQINGIPFFFGVAPIDVSPADVTSHRAHLSPLQPSTEYHIIVGATDEFDHTSYRTGTFTTITPVEHPGGLAAAGDPPGCAAQCITTALLTAGADHSSKHLSVTTHTAARIQAFASTEAPVWNDGVPSFADNDVWVPSGLEYVTEWETDLSGLAPSTGYHIIVSAIDANGHADHRVGQFQTPAAPTFDVVFTALDIHVDDDGDSGINRGELRFGWRVGDQHAGSRAEEKLSTGDTVTFPRPQSTFVAHDVQDWLPTVFVQATERDADGLIEFCSMGTGVSSQYGSNAKCDVVWNVAASGIVSLDSLDSYPLCTALGYDEVYAGQRCMTLSSVGAPGSYPDITVDIAVDVVG